MVLPLGENMAPVEKTLLDHPRNRPSLDHDREKKGKRKKNLDLHVFRIAEYVARASPSPGQLRIGKTRYSETFPSGHARQDKGANGSSSEKRAVVRAAESVSFPSFTVVSVITTIKIHEGGLRLHESEENKVNEEANGGYPNAGVMTAFPLRRQIQP